MGACPLRCNATHAPYAGQGNAVQGGAGHALQSACNTSNAHSLRQHGNALMLPNACKPRCVLNPTISYRGVVLSLFLPNPCHAADNPQPDPAMHSASAWCPPGSVYGVACIPEVCLPLLGPVHGVMLFPWGCARCPPCPLRPPTFGVLCLLFSLPAKSVHSTGNEES